MQKTFTQFIKFMLLSLIASAVELLVFSVCNYLIFKNLSEIEFNWLVFRYNVENGGLCSFLSMGLSFSAAQITNFIVQRKLTFKSESNAAKSALMYAIMVIVMYVYVLTLPGLIGSFFYSLLGAEFGALVVKVLSQTSSALIQFPLNKFLIMK